VICGHKPQTPTNNSITNNTNTNNTSHNNSDDDKTVNKVVTNVASHTSEANRHHPPDGTTPRGDKKRPKNKVNNRVRFSRGPVNKRTGKDSI